MYQRMAGCNWGSSPCYPWKQAGFSTKGEVIHHPLYRAFWEQNETSNTVIPGGKIAIVNVKEYIAKEKARTFFGCNVNTQVTGTAIYGESSAKFLEIGKSGDSWTYYGWTPFYGGVTRLVSKWTKLIEKGLTLSSFDISGWDRLMTLVTHVNEIRFATTDFSAVDDVFKRKFAVWKAWDEAPAVLFPHSSKLGSGVFRAHFQPSGKYDTTTTNSLCHRIIKLYHYYRLGVEDFDDVIYSDDNVSAAPLYANTLEAWTETYKFFGLDIRDYVCISSVQELPLIKFLGFSPVRHWNRRHMFSPAYDPDRIVWSLMNKTSKQETDKWWGLCFLAYLHSSDLFSFVFSCRDLNLEKEHPLNVLLPTKDLAINFFDQIAFGFENHFVVPENCPRLEEACDYLDEWTEEGQKEWIANRLLVNPQSLSFLRTNRKQDGNNI